MFIVFVPISLYFMLQNMTLHKKTTIHQVSTMLATSKNVVFPGHNHHANHQYWWPFTLIITLAGVWAIIKVLDHQYWWLAGGYDLEIGRF